MINKIKTGYKIYQINGLVFCLYGLWWFIVKRIRKILQTIRCILFLREGSISDSRCDKIIYIDPNRIQRSNRNTMGRKLNQPKKVYSGRWDLATKRFKDRYKVNSLINHFENNIPWGDTVYFERLSIEYIVKDRYSKQSVHNHLERYDKLYNDIKEEGYKTQAQLLEETPKETLEMDNKAEKPPLNEIGVNIGRNGEFIWQTGGQHRLAIARVLNIDEVPVQILTRHSEWQEVREEARNISEYKKALADNFRYADHPDLNEFF